MLPPLYMKAIFLQERMGTKQQTLPDCLNSEEDTRNIEVWP
jgi:hypothetical protein